MFRIAAVFATLALAIVALGVACGPEDHYCADEKEACKVVERQRMNMSDAGPDTGGLDDGGPIVLDGSTATP